MSSKNSGSSLDDVKDADPSLKPMLVGTSDGEEKQGRELEQDVFTLMFLSTAFSRPFLYSVTVMLFQFMVYLLILIDMLHNDDPYKDEDNWFSVPVYVDTAVVIAQYSAAIIAIVTQEDLITTINLISVGYDRSITETFPSATYAYWVVSCSLRFIEGALAVFVAFVFIVQSTRVLDLFMNFAAVEFVAHLDNVAFLIADMGFVGKRIQKAAEEAKEVQMPVCERSFRKLRQLAVFISISCTIGSLVYLQTKQENGTYLRGASCQRLQISFPEEFFQPEKPMNFSPGTKRNKTLFTESFFDASPPPLVYAYFSGEYIAATTAPYEDRLVYHERGLNDITSGMFYYCDSEQAWVFTIRALDESDFPDSDCPDGWLMKSQRTEVIELEDVGHDGWLVWTGSFTAADLGIICNQCYVHSDCGGHGKCDNEKSCKCNTNRTGKHCEFETPFCPRLKLTSLGDDASSFQEGSEYDLVMNNDGQTRKMMYNRPVFTSEIEDGTVFYSGTRWFKVRPITAIETTLELGEDDINHFHAYWHLNVSHHLYEYSDPTDSETPIGAYWNILELTAAVGESAPYGIAFPIKQQYVCGQCPATIKNYCGVDGICNNMTGYCECTPGTGVGGDYCEFRLGSPYVEPLAVEFLISYYSNIFFNRSWYPYAERYWNDLNDEDLYNSLKGCGMA